jgi:5-formyltetrahydrofolate cyclo-ligase
MSLDPIASRKAQLRGLFRQQFKQIPQGRIIEASMKAAVMLGPLLASFHNILSFSNIDTEVNTEPLNALLASRGQLLLPKVEGDKLLIYKVNDLENQLEKSSWKILEPIAEQCQAVSLQEIDFILVPAIAFDQENHRLGRGKGFYDRILSQIPNCPAYGLGLKEQLSEEPLPVTHQDIQLTGLYLF